MRRLHATAAGSYTLQSARNLKDGLLLRPVAQMLVTFHTRAYADITMFGDVAIELLRLMGHSGTVPGALRPEEVPAALDRLRQALAELKASRPADTGHAAGQEDDEAPPVGLATRAIPLIALLKAAGAADARVMWS